MGRTAILSYSIYEDLLRRKQEKQGDTEFCMPHTVGTQNTGPCLSWYEIHFQEPLSLLYLPLVINLSDSCDTIAWLLKLTGYLVRDN